MNDQTFKQAIFFHKNGKLKEASALYESLLKKNINTTHISILLGNLYIQTEQFLKAIELLKQANKHEKNNPFILMNLAVSNQKIGEYDLAIDFFNKVIKLDPNNADAYNNLGNLYKELGDEANCLIQFENAIKIEDGNSLFKLNRSLAYIQFHQFNHAIMELEKIKYDDELFLEIRLAYLKIYQILNDNENIVKVINEIVSSAEIKEVKKEQIIENLIYSLLKKNSLSKVPELIGLLNDRNLSKQSLQAYFYFKNNDSLKAKDIYKKLIKDHPERPDFHHNLGEIYLNDLNLDKASQYFRNSIEINDSDYLSWTSLGLCQLAQNNFIDGLNSISKYTNSFNYIFKSIGKVKYWNGQNEPVATCIYLDQGLGDAIFFASLINRLHKFTNLFYFVCDQRLTTIFRKSFGDQFKFISKEGLRTSNIKFKYFHHGIFLAQLFIKKLDDLNLQKKFLRADPISKFKYDSPLVGISWYSANEFFGKDRSISLEALVGKLSRRFKNFISLQYGDFDEEIDRVAKKYNVNFINHDNDNFQNIDNLFKLIKMTDEIFTISNSTIHFAGALGKKSHLLLSYNDSAKTWYWNAKKDGHSMWYPSVEIHYPDKDQSLEDIHI